MRLQQLGLACLAGALCVGELTAGPRGGGGGRGGAGAGGGRSVGGQSSPGGAGRSEPGRTGGAEAGRVGGFNGANDPGRNNPGNDPGRGFNNDPGRNNLGNEPGRGFNNDPGRNNIGTAPGVGAPGRPASANDLQGFLGLPGQSGERAAATRTGSAANWNPNESLAAHAPATQPFTPSWYADHPNAFQAQYPHADAWRVATPAGLGRWLNVPVVATGTGYGTGSTTYVESAPAETTAATSDPNATAANTEAAPAGDWMTIGVYGLAPVADKESHRMLQLVVNRDGVIRGSHYDLITDETQDVQGQLDKNSQHVNWTIGAKGSVVFDALLGDLTKDQAIAVARYASGNTNQWKLTKANNPSTSAPVPAGQ